MTKLSTAAAGWVKPAAPKVDHLPLMHLGDIPTTNTLMFTFAKAVSMRRDHGSTTEAEFVAWLTRWLPVTMVDTLGNLHIDLRSDKAHRTLFTSHVDSVHHGGGHNRVRIDGKYWRADGAALGADDGAGVALLAHLITNEVPGYYILFRGEECGGIGSSGLYAHDPDFFKAFDRAVAFDRAGYNDVITHQGGARCASDEFAQALSDALTPPDFSLAFMPCDRGVYTDTAEFVDTIPECTNVSVGYFSQHGEHEHQDIDFLQQLAVQLLKVRWDELPTRRDPHIYEDKWETLHTGGRRHDMVFRDPRIELSALAKTAIRACELWLKGTSRKDLLDLVAKSISLEHPDIARRCMNPSLIHDNDVREAMLSLEYGWDADAILTDLFAICEMRH